jgi:hypothetical protein
MRALIHPSLRDVTTTRLEVQALKRLAKINRRYAANSLTTLRRPTVRTFINITHLEAP